MVGNIILILKQKVAGTFQFPVAGGYHEKLQPPGSDALHPVENVLLPNSKKPYLGGLMVLKEFRIHLNKPESRDPAENLGSSTF